ncbi:MAG: NYN domain-containing protein [Candidatus Obscuribacterales bacterium]
MKDKTYVYIDGFNLFYGCLKNTQYKWLNIRKMCELLLPNLDIQKIYYFTAKVSGTERDPDKPQRQLAYIRALRTLPGVEIIDGHFISEDITLPLADGTGEATVRRSKEKRSDVNLASQLLWDAHCQSFQVAVVVSGDSDFRTPISMVRSRYMKDIGVLDPQRDGTPNSPMNKEATFYKPIRVGVLKASQFSDQLSDAKGSFAKPADWWQ